MRKIVQQAPLLGYCKITEKNKVKHYHQLEYIISVIFLRQLFIYVYFMSLKLER